MIKRLLTIAALCFFASAAVAQQPDVDTLLQTIFAEDCKTLLRFLPPEFQKGYQKLSRDQRKEFDAALPLVSVLRRDGLTVAHPEGGGPFLVVDETGGGLIGHVELTLIGRDYGNDRSELRLRVASGSDNPVEGVVRLRFVYPDWRIYEFEAPSERKSMRLDNEMLPQQMLDNFLNQNQSMASNKLFVYRNALGEYESTYPEIGLPQSLTDLGPPGEGVERDEIHAGLVGEDLAKPPYEVHRYRFHYTRKDRDHFTIIARPVKYGITGHNSYFIDESGTIRFTDKDREPTAESELLFK